MGFKAFLGGAAKRYSENLDEKEAYLRDKVSKNREYLLTAGLSKFEEIKNLKNSSKARIAEGIKLGFTQQAARALEFQGGLETQIIKLKKIAESKGGTVNREALETVSELIWNSIPDEEGREKILNYFTDNGVPSNVDDLQDQFIRAITNAQRDDADFLSAREILSRARERGRPDVTVTVPPVQNYQALTGDFGLQTESKLQRNIAARLSGIAGATFSFKSENDPQPQIVGENAQQVRIAIDNLIRGYKNSYNRNENALNFLDTEILRLKEFLLSGQPTSDVWTAWNKANP